MSDQYFVIGMNDEGNPYIEAMSRETVQRALDPDDGWLDPEKVMSDIPTADPSHWKSRYVILRGEFIMPRAQETVVEWVV